MKRHSMEKPCGDEKKPSGIASVTAILLFDFLNFLLLVFSAFLHENFMYYLIDHIQGLSVHKNAE